MGPCDVYNSTNMNKTKSFLVLFSPVWDAVFFLFVASTPLNLAPPPPKHLLNFYSHFLLKKKIRLTDFFHCLLMKDEKRGDWNCSIAGTVDLV